jgi:hypothetical protein
MQLLRRKAEIICSCYKDIQNYQELILQLVGVLKQKSVPASKEYAMHIFELLAEYHLP